MVDKFCLDINIPSDYIAPQFMCFPLAAVRADPDARNWYYQHYMMPLAKLDGVNSLTCEISDAIAYGAGGKVYNKVMRLSSINKTVCAQIGDIVSVLRENISKQYYCVLFLDFYDVSCAETYYGKHHFMHEILFYGYDNALKTFSCYGYFEHLYRMFSLPYDEVERAFADALQYIETMGGWREYMFITMRRFGHEMPSPYSNEKFLDKLEIYVKGEATEQFQYENLMYLKPSEHSVSRAGRGVTEIFMEYINMLETLLVAEELYGDIDSQITAFNVFKNYHNDIAERLSYYAEINGMEKKLGDYISDYQMKAARKSTEIRMLYIKFLCMVEKKMPVEKVLGRLRDELNILDKCEGEILNGFLNVAKHFII